MFARNASSHHSNSISPPTRRRTQSQSAKATADESAVIDPQIFPTTQTLNFYKVIVRRKMVSEKRIIWDDFPCQDAMLADDLINHYHLQKVNSPPSSFNLSVVQEFYAYVPSNFPDSRGKFFVQGIYDSRVICDILGLDLSNAYSIHVLDFITYYYDMKAYHCEAYLDFSIHLIQNQASKSRLKFSIRIGLISFAEMF